MSKPDTPTETESESPYDPDYEERRQAVRRALESEMTPESRDIGVGVTPIHPLDLDYEYRTKRYADVAGMQTIQAASALPDGDMLVVYEVYRDQALDEVLAVIHSETHEKRYVFTVLERDDSPPLITYDSYVWYELEGAVPITSRDDVHPVPAAVIEAVGRAGYDVELAFG